MKILQQPVKAKRNEIIQIHFDKPVVVKLLSKSMFVKYKNGAKHTSQGGFYEKSPAKFTIPYDGVWHAVIEKGSHFNPINVTGKVELLPPVVKESHMFFPEEDEDNNTESPAAIEAETADDNLEENEESNEDLEEDEEDRN